MGTDVSKIDVSIYIYIHMEANESIAIVTGGPVAPTMAPAPETAVAEAGGFLSSKWFRYGLLVLILAFLGYNLFTYLGKATDVATSTISQAVKPVVKPAVSIAKTAVDAVEDTVEKVAELAEEGVETVVDTTGDVAKQIVSEAKTGITAAADSTAKIAKSGLNKLAEATDMKALNNARARQNREPAVPMADDALSNTQARQTTSQAGYCYIGEQGGIRSCIKVNESDMCMSGDIFPTHAICVNPTLRE